MIYEQYVSFEVAKLLKEKGFSCKEIRYVYRYYEEDDDYCYEKILDGEKFDSKKMIAVPTLQTAMRWLREVHTIVVVAFPIRTVKGELAYNASIYNTDAEHKKLMNKDYQSYEQACEETTKYCLENLI